MVLMSSILLMVGIAFLLLMSLLLPVVVLLCLVAIIRNIRTLKPAIREERYEYPRRLILYFVVLALCLWLIFTRALPFWLVMF